MTRWLSSGVVLVLVAASLAGAQQSGAPSAAGSSPGTWQASGETATAAQPSATPPAAATASSPSSSPTPTPAATNLQPSGGSTGRVGAIPGADANRTQVVPAEQAARTSSNSVAVPPGAATGPSGQQSSAGAASATPRAPITRVTTGTGSLPNEHGQLYREYDISPYTLRVTTTKRPEQAIVDWILRETGYETWHAEPLAILSAGPRVLRVYHTPQVQAVVAEIVDRFNSSEAETQAFSLRVITLDNPNWRVRVQRLLNPVTVQTPGVQAWLLEKEAAALVLAELRRRSDYREHHSPQLLVHNGQPTVVAATRGRNYIRNIKLRPDAWPGFEPETGIVDEGFSLEFTPLVGLDGKTVDATIRCDVDQVERVVPVMLDVPTVAAPRQRTRVEVPQVAQFRFHERFRWPIDRVLMIELGMVAVPVPTDGKSLVAGLPLPISNGPARADLLLVIEGRGKLPDVQRLTRGSSPQSDYLRAR